jgi:hypothetical protein
MVKVIHNVAEMDTADRRALEHLIGDRLAEHQQIIISVVDLERARPAEPLTPAPTDVPEWWNVYEGLNDEDVDRLDQAIRSRAELTREIE